MILRIRDGGCFWGEEVGCDRSKALGVLGWLPGFYLWFDWLVAKVLTLLKFTKLYICVIFLYLCFILCLKS